MRTAPSCWATRCSPRIPPGSGLPRAMSGHGQPSFDKQFAGLAQGQSDNDWTLPQEIVDKTIAKYLQAYRLLTGTELPY